MANRFRYFLLSKDSFLLLASFKVDFFAIFIEYTYKWVFINYFSQKPLYNYKEIKKNYEEKKLFLDQYEKSITDLKEKIAELRYDYDLLKNESILSSSKKPKVTESRSVIRNLERSKKSIFSSIPSEETTGNFSLTTADFKAIYLIFYSIAPQQYKVRYHSSEWFFSFFFRTKFFR